MKIGDVMSFRSKAKGKKTITGTVVKVNAKSYWLDIGEKWVKRKRGSK